MLAILPASAGRQKPSRPAPARSRRSAAGCDGAEADNLGCVEPQPVAKSAAGGAFSLSPAGPPSRAVLNDTNGDNGKSQSRMSPSFTGAAMNRRHFLMSTAVMAGSAAIKGLAQSPNNRVRIAVIGLGGRGGSHISAWSRMDNVEIVGICDVDESHIGEKFKLLQARGGKAPTTFVDFRKILDDKSIDAVSIATPNHWHTLMTVLACQAGKDVYVEKPCSHNVFESQQIVAAARKYNRIVQQGSQDRKSVV